MLKRSVVAVCLVSLIALAGELCAGGVGRLPLHHGWRFKQVRGRNWYPATVPGVVQSDLMANDVIPDPFVGMNERAVQWVDKEDWEYECTFNLTAEQLAADNFRLVFEGLDTYADVYLNDAKLIIANNMFRSWRKECKELLEPGENHLRVYFHSPIKIDLPKVLALDFAYPAVNDQSENGGLLERKVSVFARKAGYHYGWDWGPRLVTMGIWRPVYLEHWDELRFEDVHITTREITPASAQVEVKVEVDSGIECDAVLEVVGDASGRVYATRRTELSPGVNKLTLAFTLNNPRLWWSNGLGEPFLYDFKVRIKEGDQVFDTRVVPTGIRSIRLVTELDMAGEGSTFFFELNGVPVFMKGANYIPNDSFLPRVTREQYRDVVARAADANMNMLRVWGGGIYEDDYFYELCDQNGILVWQDFMFSCSMYPLDQEIEANIRAEAIENVKRLRNHASLALWCGNNEMNEAFYNWGWKQQFAQKGVALRVKMEYDRLFDHLLPEVVREFNPEIDYRSSSPYSDLYPEERNDKSGDRHYWDVWHGKAPFTSYEEAIPRFMSEYGFQSFPELSTVRSYAAHEKHWDIESDVMLAHQRHPSGNELIRVYMERNYREPRDFRSFLYMSQLLQADGMRLAQEAHRRNMPYCMGTLYWQHNDCWPVASWSTSDYYGKWKASHYRTRKSYERVIVSVTKSESEGRMSAYVVSDLLEPLQGELTLKLMSLTGATHKERRESVTVEANSSLHALEIDLDDFLGGLSPSNVLVSAVFKSRILKADSIYLLAPLKSFELPITTLKTEITEFKGGYSIKLSSDHFARGVYLALDDAESPFFSDNYFDLLPGESRVVVVRSAKARDEFTRKLRVISMCDAIKGQ
ncbi:MAG: glycoside hydrolase family 2 protein [Kiritimatiellae bacterium]|nr:glycoside hydrolase family 2 protein [Kiritimatiellia bacterium]